MSSLDDMEGGAGTEVVDGSLEEAQRSEVARTPLPPPPTISSLADGEGGASEEVEEKPPPPSMVTTQLPSAPNSGNMTATIMAAIEDMAAKDNKDTEGEVAATIAAPAPAPVPVPAPTEPAPRPTAPGPTFVSSLPPPPQVAPLPPPPTMPGTVIPASAPSQQPQQPPQQFRPTPLPPLPPPPPPPARTVPPPKTPSGSQTVGGGQPIPQHVKDRVDRREKALTPPNLGAMAAAAIPATSAIFSSAAASANSAATAFATAASSTAAEAMAGAAIATSTAAGALSDAAAATSTAAGAVAATAASSSNPLSPRRIISSVATPTTVSSTSPAPSSASASKAANSTLSPRARVFPNASVTPAKGNSTGRRRRGHTFVPQPAPSNLASLAKRQYEIPVLVVPTAESKAMVWEKNRLTVPDLLTAMANSIIAPSGLDPNGNAALYPAPPRLPTLRSVGKTLTLTWDAMRLRFVDGEAIAALSDVRYVETELNDSALVWEGDGDLQNELFQLERRVGTLISSAPDTVATPDDDEEDEEEHANNEQADDDTFTAKEDPVKAAAKQAFGLSSPPNVPWLLRFRDALDRTTSYLPHDNIGSPPVCVLVSSTSDVGPLDCLTELSNVLHLPRPYQNGLFDSNGMRREYVLLHDEVDGPPEFNESAYVAEMQRRFGPGCCAVLRINSVRRVNENDDAAGSHDGNEDPVWDAVLPSPSPPQRSHEVASYNRGMCLSENDKATLRRYLATLVTSSLIPAMERRIANLNVIVSNAKKGVKNVFKSLWRKPRESGLGGSSHGAPDGIVAAVAEEDQELVKYRHDTIESQTLLLANTLFLMRDYESSLGIYRLVKDDYKSDRNLLHYASVHEMMALCIYMLDPQGHRFGRELFTDFETALYSYTRAADDDRASASGKALAPNPEALPATRLTTRLCLVISSTQALCDGRHLEIADLLASASSHESPLGAAVLLEQAAAHYYHAEMCRKFAFHMLMAGHMFRSASQEHHAFRCFTSALFVYHDGRWEELHNHLRSALAAQLYGMRRMAMSLQLYSKLVGMTGGGRVSVRSQQKFLNHLIDICRRHSVDALVGSDRMRQDRGGLATKAGLFRTGSVEDVLTRTPNATRAVEIYGMDLPRIDDSSVSVTAGAVSTSLSSVSSGGQSTPFGTLGTGSEDVWKDMMMSVQAELLAEKEAAKGNEKQGQQDDSQESEALAKADPMSARVVTVFNREKADAALLASRRKKTATSSPESRARMEPIAVTFTMSNPLSVQIRLTEIQLVASFKGAASDAATKGRTCTNEDAIDISVVSASDSANGETATASSGNWKFHSSVETFEVANFTRLSPLEVDHGNSEGADDGNKPGGSGVELTPWTSAHGQEPPFFVVTKSKAEIDPGTTIRISLSICPLVTGDLEILGMRCKLFNEVWVYHKFRVLGPLLQDTSINRAKRARGESSMLKSKVGDDMPNLAVEFVPSENSAAPGRNVAVAVLQGQMVDWSIRVANLGTAPASSVTLKTNSPWLIVRDGPSAARPEKSWDAESTSHTVGPTGTLLRLPLRKIQSNDGSVENVLQPGEVADVPVRLRTLGVGSQGFYMLFRYERTSSTAVDSKHGPLRHRWLRKMITVPVFPSLSLAASLMPSYWMKREHLLSVEITNYRTDHQTTPYIFLDSLCIASRHFRVRQLPGQIAASGGENGGLGDLQKVGGRLALPIGWQERVTLHYVVSPLESDDGTFVLSRCHVGGGSEDVLVENFARDVGGARVTDFLCLDVAHNKFTVLLDEHSKELARLEAEQEQEGSGPRSISAIRRAKSTDPNVESGGKSTSSLGTDAADVDNDKLTSGYHPTSLDNLCPPKGTEAVIHVMCVWAAPENGSDRLVKGQHQLHNLSVRPHRQSKGCPLTITAKHKSEVSHDFGQCPLRLDLEVTVRNRLVESAVKFEFAVEPHPEFEFVGAESFSWSLEGGEEVVVPLQAVIPRSGVYNLQKIRLTVKGSDEEGTDIPYLFPLQWIVTVTSL